MESSFRNESEPRIRDTLKEDFHRRVNWDSFRRDLREIKEFYISDEKKDRLKAMPPVKRAFWLTVWVLKSLILRLAPTRRILLIIAFIFFFSGNTIIKHNNITISNYSSISAIILVLVILLELKDKLLARDELEAGRKVQRALTPERSPSIPGWQVFLFTSPANEVGGDLVDYLPIDENRYLISIADVSGKGLQAALLTAKLQATIRALSGREASTANLFNAINEIIYRDRVPSSFASLLSIEIHSQHGRVHYVNAGHLPPLLISANGYRELLKGEPALGLMGTTQYHAEALELQSGDIFLAYSDGVTEARNAQGQFFGHDRLLAILPTIRTLPVDHIGEHIIRTVERFVGNAPASDDLSLTIVKRM